MYPSRDTFLIKCFPRGILLAECDRCPGKAREQNVIGARWRDCVLMFLPSSLASDFTSSLALENTMEQPEAKKQRFSTLSKDEIEKLLEQKDSLNTLKVTEK